MSTEKELATVIFNEYLVKQENLKIKIDQLEIELNKAKAEFDKCNLAIKSMQWLSVSSMTV